MVDSAAQCFPDLGDYERADPVDDEQKWLSIKESIISIEPTEVLSNFPDISSIDRIHGTTAVGFVYSEVILDDDTRASKENGKIVSDNVDKCGVICERRFGLAFCGNLNSARASFEQLNKWYDKFEHGEKPNVHQVAFAFKSYLGSMMKTMDACDRRYASLYSLIAGFDNRDQTFHMYFVSGDSICRYKEFYMGSGQAYARLSTNGVYKPEMEENEAISLAFGCIKYAQHDKLTGGRAMLVLVKRDGNASLTDSIPKVEG